MNEKRYVSLVCSLGCIVTGRPAVPHHPRFAGYAGKRAPDWLVIPLCPELHTDGPDAYHVDRSRFEMLHGTEVELLARTIQAVVQHLDKNQLPF